MKQIFIILFVIFFIYPKGYSQNMIRGIVLEESTKGTFTPIMGATAFWLGTNEGTQSDTSGVFKLSYPQQNVALDSSRKYLIIRYLGYTSDTIEIKNDDKISVILAQEANHSLQEIEVTERINSTFLNSLEPLNTKTMSEKELFKAACCNLSESFETNPSVDVNFADAVSGAKQIQMLGLSGIYTQLSNENLPGTRGLAANYGLGYIPGSWIESIQVTKGAGSVANGYESIAGQINVELKKTDISMKLGERLFLNTYANDFGRLEANANYTQKISPKWATTLLLHGNGQSMKIDQNKDNFLDIPLGYQVNGINRWKYDNNKGFMVQFGIKALKDYRLGGEMNFDESKDKLSKNIYGLGINTERLEAFTKIGYVFPQKKYKSIGFMASALSHKTDNYFGQTVYNANQESIYANLIYQSIIDNTQHKFRTGLSFLLDNYDEKLAQIGYNPLKLNLKRTEIVPGAFMEYTWLASSKFTFVAGLRADYHNLYGVFFTPRIHAKYDATENTQIRISAGRGQRTANMLAENMGILARSRQVNILNLNSTQNYPSQAEIGWNYGMSISQDFRLNYKKGNVTLDYYRTDFQNQVVVDYDKSPQQINFYNLNGLSFSNSVQVELNYEIIKRLDIRVAYRLYDVQTTYHGLLLQRPLIAQNRAFINLAYSSKNNWKFDYTLTWNGTKRIPNTQSNPLAYKNDAYSPDYFVMNAQISKSFGNQMKKWLDLYIGVENIGDFRQQDLIIASSDPFGSYFDTSLIWGPIVGRMVYVGARFKIK